MVPYPPRGRKNPREIRSATAAPPLTPSSLLVRIPVTSTACSKSTTPCTNPPPWRSTTWSPRCCSARWRIRRATGIETALIDCEMVTEEPKLKQKFATVDTGMVLASAFRSLADESHSMAMLNRYESRLRRMHKQAHAMLLRLRLERRSEPAPPEPPPAPTPVPDGPEVCVPPTPAAPSPAADDL